MRQRRSVTASGVGDGHEDALAEVWSSCTVGHDPLLELQFGSRVSASTRSVP
ncbi:hypothetical protein [Streptomyces sp. HD]|uniref:hypothetical protein n=1 Tax=Streptomyces sp. HD TaxID=3020892 RepID=UPI00232CD52D|nr:hypothetical protein [Streptomyces sp. HD]MDC0770783.1 hypothetical protein [Streptomyces sp. HD]